MKYSNPSKAQLQAEADHYAQQARVGEMNERTAAGRGDYVKAHTAKQKKRRLWWLARVFSRLASQTPERN